MAIRYARLEFVKRSSGKNAIAKSAYNSKEKLHFFGNHLSDEKIYDWSRKGGCEFHKICLPKHVDLSFSSSEVLWNYVEKFEIKKNAVIQNELVLALPDDKEISKEDRINLVESFVNEHFILKGFAVQVDIHAPEKKGKKSNTHEEYEGGGDHNWHAHILVTTRRFLENGKEFEKNKPREQTTSLRGGRVISGPNWGKIWAQHQNEYFESKGLSLRVDLAGAVPQKHLGPVRMRAKAFSLLQEDSSLKELNKIESGNPNVILEKILETKSVFSKEDVDRFLGKHVDQSNIAHVKEVFWKQKEIVELISKKTGKPTFLYTTQSVIDEEKQMVRLADRMHETGGKTNKKVQALDKNTSNLSQEQVEAFRVITNGSLLSCIEGYAGTGKSYLLVALKNHYENAGITVRAFGPDNATVGVLKEKGFTNGENVHRFLFSYQNGKREIAKGKEVWVIDEAGKLGNRPMLELLKTAEKNNVQIVFSGCRSQHRSVDRGGGFSLFCERFGSVKLEDIQRQKFEDQRQMAKNLATGKMGEALDQLVASRGIVWSNTKEESLVALINQWCLDKQHFPENKTLIIAYTNAEVCILNDLVRTYLKSQKEIEENEYSCETPFGQVFVSVGDKIQFRKNDKDIGVFNGMIGSIVNASENNFIVSVEDGKKIKSVSFNPAEYNHFHPAYASTSYKSQGDTSDRVYVYHSYLLNKQDFYVNLTRHRKKVQMYVSREETSSLFDLKFQAYRSSSKPMSFDFVTKDQLEDERNKQIREKTIRGFKESDSFISKLKGYSMTAMDGIRSRSEQVVSKYKDRLPNQSFFNPNLEAYDKVAGKVTSVAANHSKESVDESETHFKQGVVKKGSLKAVVALSDVQKREVDNYYNLSDRSSTLYTIVLSEAESNGKSKELQPHFKDWQIACGQRNEKAYDLVNSMGKDKIEFIFSKRALPIIYDRAHKHEQNLARSKENSVDIEAKLRSNIEPLLFRLFPEGPSRRERNALRFGAKGSLKVDISGSEYGRFYDFAQEKGGGFVSLIANRFGLEKDDAIDWAKNFLNEDKSSFVPKNFSIKSKVSITDEKWKSIIPDPSNPAPSFSVISKTLFKTHREDSRYAYRDSTGNPIFYVLRVVGREDGSKKIILPLSFGHFEGINQSPRWGLKAYSGTNRPIYNQHLIFQMPSAKVLIVEGEKSADAASEIFSKENMVCITWCGGASAVKKTDWTPLHGREVVIWPDNDVAGYKASETLCSELRKSGAKSIAIVDKELLSSYPEKWDLADSLPSGKSIDLLHDMILRSKDKRVGIDQVILGIGFNISEKDPLDLSIERMRVNDVLSIVENRLWSNLEDKCNGKIAEVKSEVYSETVKILSQGKELEERLQKDFGIADNQAKSVSYQTMLVAAENGVVPEKDKIEEIRKIVSIAYSSKDQKMSSQEAYGLDKSIQDSCKSPYIKVKNEAVIQKQKEHSDRISKNLDKETEKFAINEQERSR